MKDCSPKIYFYIPKEYWPIDGIPEKPNTYWYDFNQGITPGVYAWTIQTYQYLKANGLSCELIGELPAEGIVLAHRKSLPEDLKPNSQLLIVCLKAESAAHPYAQIHIVGNHRDMNTTAMIWGDRYLYPGQKYYIPHWPQPGLIPRDVNRGDRFENIAFFGESINLAAQLKTTAWERELHNMGLQWHLVDRDRSHTWNDYSYVDAIVAVRKLDQQVNYTWKPALKLYNAWHAGVPAILGRESAYQQERRSDWDYLEVSSLEDTLNALRKLREDRDFRSKIVENGLLRAQEINSTQITQIWQNIIAEKLIPAYQTWCNSPGFSRNFLQRREFGAKTREKRKQIQQLRNIVGLRTRLRSLVSLQK
jgi:hypothetical protein